MKYSIEDLKAELLAQRFDLGPKGVPLWVIDYDDVLTAIGNLETDLREIRDSAKNLSLDKGCDVVPDLIKELLEE